MKLVAVLCLLAVVVTASCFGCAFFSQSLTCVAVVCFCGFCLLPSAVNQWEASQVSLVHYIWPKAHHSKAHQHLLWKTINMLPHGTSQGTLICCLHTHFNVVRTLFLPNLLLLEHGRGFPREANLSHLFTGILEPNQPKYKQDVLPQRIGFILSHLFHTRNNLAPSCAEDTKP